MESPLAAYSVARGDFMHKEYPVLSGDIQVGKAYVERHGLYYRIKCICNLDESDFTRIFVSDGNNKENLGTCIPNGEQFYLEKQIPVKRLGEDKLSFYIVEGKQRSSGRFIPVQEQFPFRHLSELSKACLEERNGSRGVLIPD